MLTVAYNVEEKVRQWEKRINLFSTTLTAAATTTATATATTTTIIIIIMTAIA